MSAPELDIEQGITNLLRNGGFELWQSGTPAYWTLAGAGGTVTQDTSVFAVGLSSVRLGRSGADVTLTQNVVGQTLPLTAVQGKTYTFSCRIKKTSGKKARVKLDDGVGVTVSGYACDVLDFMALSVTRIVDLAATKLSAVCEVYDADGECWFDAAMLTEGPASPNFTPNPADAQDPINQNQTAPTAPTGFGVTARTTTIFASWLKNPEADISEYKLQRSDDAGFSVNLTTFNVHSTGYLDTPGDFITHYYRVAAVRTSGAVSTWSSTASTAALTISSSVVDTTAPATPTGLQAVTGTYMDVDGTARPYLTISWNANGESDLGGYQVDFKPTADTPWNSKLLGSATTSYRTVEVIGNTAYDIRIKAFDIWNNNSSWSSVVNITSAKDTAPPAAPTGVSVTAGFQLNVVRWTPPTVEDFDVVEIWRSTSNDSSTAAKVGEHRGIMWVDDKLSNSTTYYYWLKSRDYSGNVSAFHTTQYAGVSGLTLAVDMGTGDVANKLARHIALGNEITAGNLSASGITFFDAVTATDGALGGGAWHTDSSVAGAYIRVDCGIGITKDFVQVMLWANAAGYPGIFEVEYSDNDSSWTSVFAGFAPNKAGWNAASWAIGAGHRYWRLRLTNTPGAGTYMDEIVWFTLGATLANVVVAGRVAAKVIEAFHLVTDTAVITETAQIKDAIISSAKIVDLVADKIAAGTMTVSLKVGVNQVDIDGVNSRITVKDTQASPVTRVQLGKLGAGASDYGIKIWDAAGTLMYDFSDGGVVTAGIKNLAVATGKVAANAITNGNVSVTTGTVSGGGGSTTEIQSVSVSSDGGAMLVIGKAVVIGGVDPEDAVVYLYKTDSGGTLLDSASVLLPTSGINVVTLVGYDTSPSGTQVYKMYISSDLTTISASYRSLAALNVKK